MAVLTTAYHVEMAKLAVNSFTADTPKYIFIGHPDPWVNINGSYNDTVIPNANISIFQSEGAIYTDLAFGKLITSTDVINMISRYNWTSNTVYAKYWNKDANLYSKNFYVVTDDLNVYKCIDNNYGNPSLVKPILTSQQGNFLLADGYVWKYMYTIPSDINSKFSTVNYIPITSNASVVANAIPGTVDVIDLTSLGNNYASYYTGFLQNSVNSYVVVLDSNASPYSDYYVGSSMYLKAGYGAGQIREIVQYDGLNKLVRLNSPFNSYGVFSLSDIFGNFNTGDTFLQTIDKLSIYYNVGVFQIGDTIAQSDTGAIGQIISSNSTYLNVVRNNSILFDTNIPIYNTIESGIIQPGTVNVQPLPILAILSNTNPFTIGEVIYQSNGSANVGVGIVFSAQTDPVVSVNFNPSISVNSTSGFISISNNQFSNGMEVIYNVSAGNTVIFGLVNNASYIVINANTSGVALATPFFDGLTEAGDTLVSPDGSSLFVEGLTSINISTSISETFNPNTGIDAYDFISISGNQYINGEPLTYTVSTGNTIPVGLSNGFLYYTVYANTSGLCLSQTLNGPNVNILATTVSETGHNLTFNIPSETGDSLSYTPIRLLISRSNGAFTNTYQVAGNTSGSNAHILSVTSNSYGMDYIFTSNSAQTTFSTSYYTGSYIRVGNNSSNNIKRILSVNSFYLTIDSPLAQTAISNVHYLIPNAAEISSYTLLNSNGIITNTNLTSVQINYSNASLSFQLFIPGERVDMVNSNNTFQGVYGTVSYCNTSTVIISGVVGSGFLQGFYLNGESSTLSAYINYIISYPNITVYNPVGNFVIGQQAYSRSTSNLSIINGQANVLSWYTIPGQLTEYIISPTVTIEGDGYGALAYSTVNTSATSSFPLSEINVINNGTGYTYANVIITSNALFGSGATALAGISPLLGHGADPLTELGASYVSISVNISNSSLEGYYFPTFGNYRVVGIIDNPLFDNLYITVNDFDRIKLSINSASNNFIQGEFVYQPNTLSGGTVVYSNSSYLELKDIIKTSNNFSANGLYPNNVISNDNIIGMLSGTVANVSSANISNFNISTSGEVVIESSIANAILVAISNTTSLQVTNVSGILSSNSIIYDPLNNAYANVISLKVDNNFTDVTTTFGHKFNQTLRIPLTSNTAPFEIFEYVTQSYSNASGRIIGGKITVPSLANTVIGNDIDLTYSNTIGSFSIGDVIYNAGNVGIGIVIWANTSYLRLTSVFGTFSDEDSINNTIGSSATIDAFYPVLILNDVFGTFNTGVLSGNISGLTTGSLGRCDLLNVIRYPDLVRDSGKVLYLENLPPFSLSNNSKEVINLLLQY